LENQYGFRAKHSTDHVILCIIDNIQKAIILMTEAIPVVYSFILPKHFTPSIARF